MSQSLINGLFEKLQEAGAGKPNTLVGGRIFHLQGESDDLGMSGVTTTTLLPHITFQVITNPLARGMAGNVKQDMNVQIDIYGKREAGAAALGAIEQAVFTLLDAQSVTVAGHDRGVITCINRDVRNVEDDAIRSMSEYRVQATSS